eukprot:SM000063S19994  [mRNA]  locus=s63:95985:98258:- [translate_table: standard]
MAVSSLSYSLMGLFVKLLASQHPNAVTQSRSQQLARPALPCSGGGIPSLQTVTIRCAVISLMAGWELRRMGHPLFGTPRVRHLVMARAIIGFVALSTFFYRQLTCPISLLQLLFSPVLRAVLAAAFLKERWGRGEMAGTLCSFLGVLLVSQPEILFGGDVRMHQSSRLGVFMALVGAFTGALSYIIVRAVGKRGEPPLVCVFAFAALSTPLGALGALFQGFKVPSLAQFICLLAVGFTAYTAQLEKAAKATSIQYIKVLGTYILGVAFLSEVPNVTGAIGALLIAASAACLTYGSRH